jgi:hypothetical protein
MILESNEWSAFDNEQFDGEECVDDRCVADLVITIDAFLKEVQDCREPEAVSNYCESLENEFLEQCDINSNAGYSCDVNDLRDYC